MQQIGGHCPDGWIVMQGERPSAEHVAQEDGSWVLLEPDYVSVIADRRWQAETVGIIASGMPVDTDDRSKLLINGAALEAMIDPAYILKWKTPGGFIELNADQVIAVARAVRAHVQACFDREDVLLEALAEGTFTEAMLEEGWPSEPLPESTPG